METRVTPRQLRRTTAVAFLGALAVLAALLAAGTAGCVPPSTPPDADVVAGVVDQVGYEFMRWEEGLAIMIWHDAPARSGTSSTSGAGPLTHGTPFRIEGYAESQDGHRFEWQVETDDGRTALFSLDDVRYDLSDGTVFIVRTGEGANEVTQLDGDLSHVDPDHASCVAFARNDSHLARFLESAASPPEASPTPLAASPTPTEGAAIYRNEDYGFEIRLPEDVVPGMTCPTQGVVDDPVNTFRLTGTRYYSGTNLLDACMTVGVDRGEGARATCVCPRNEQEECLGQEEINGIPFVKVGRGGVATGHIYDVITYRTTNAGACYELTLFLHYANMGVYEPGTITEFDEETLRRQLTGMIQSFRFLP